MADVSVRTTLNAPADIVWAAVSDFGALDKYHPLVAGCTI